MNAALKFTTNAYASSVQEVADEEKTCDSTIYGGDSGPIAGMCVHARIYKMIKLTLSCSATRQTKHP